MGMRPSPEEWEQVLGSDLMPHLIPPGQQAGARQPEDVTWLPPGARQALGAAIGRHGLEDLLIVPAAAWWYGGPHGRCLYAPLCVLGAGERAAGLWVQALPEPGVPVVVPFSEVAVIGQEADGPQRRLIITGHGSRLLVRHDATGSMPADAVARRVRRRAAGDPAPGEVPAISLWTGRAGRRLPDAAALRLDRDETAFIGNGSHRGEEIVLAVSSRELIISGARTARPGQGSILRSLYVPRQNIEGASIRAGTLRLRSAGQDLRIELGSRKFAAAAASWLPPAFSSYHQTRADS